MPGFLQLIQRFSRDDRGAFAVIFGLMAVILIAMGGAVVDYVYLEQTRGRAQIALDAAALALQPDIDTLSESQLEIMAQALVDDRIGDDRVTADIVDVTVDMTVGSLYLEATVNMPTIFVQLVGVDTVGGRIHAEATKGSLDVEVAVAIDLSNSMNNAIDDGEGGTTTKIASLETALGELIDMVVKDDQTPTYSKMALVPYSMAVNLGSYAASQRGAAIQATPITSVAWAFGAGKNITGATRANPVVITSNAHGFVDGNRVYITGVTGMTQLNNKIYTVKKINNNSYSIGVNGTSYGNFNSTSIGTATHCQTTNCELVVTSNSHGLAAGESVYIYGVGGMTINNTANESGSNIQWPVGTPVTANSFVLTGTTRTSANYGTYTSGGSAQCLRFGCEYYYFTNRYGSMRKHRISTCVTERSPNTYTDVPASTTLVGKNYPSASNVCLTNQVVPLTSNKDTLHGLADNLTASGSTGGHIGVGWAWYMVSPNFNGPWPAASQPAPVDPINPVVRAVVIMTDGEYNTVYCNGVIARNSLTGSGDTNSHINCDGTGTAYSQTTALCDAMKDTGVIVYTVGFAIDDKPVAQAMMEDCASDENKSFEANSGTELSDVFREIGDNLSQLRLTN